MPLFSAIDNNNIGPPYRFLDDKNMYICNLCECTYDSLRSMKAHLWKHSGHQDISYPMKEMLIIGIFNNEFSEKSKLKIVNIETSNEATSSSGSILKIDCEEIVTGNEVTIESANDEIEASSITSSSASNSSNRSTTGICSALLEVIEKFRETEDNCNEEIEIKKSKEIIKSKRGRKRKLNELISEKDLLELNVKKRATVVNIINNKNEAIKTKFLNNKKQQLNFLCIKCKKQFLNKINLENHVTNECIEESDTSTERNDKMEEYEIIYACNICDFKCLIKENLIDHVTKLHSNSADCLKLEIKGESIKPTIVDTNRKTIRIHNSIKRRFLSPPPKQHAHNAAQSTQIPATLIQNSTNNKFLSLLISLATNDGYEQYVCGLCPYVCYHLPSLKSHMWTHVTNQKFDYSLNTTIINAALDYENKLNRQLLSYNGANDSSATPFNDLANPYELVNYPLNNKISQQANVAGNLTSCDKPMVSFRCSKCGYSTINLSLLRLHKRQHYIKIITPNTVKTQNLNKINDKETQKFVINS